MFELLLGLLPMEIIFLVVMVLSLLVAGEEIWSDEQGKYICTRKRIPMWTLILILVSSFIPVVNMVTYCSVSIIWWLDATDGIREDSELLNRIIRFLKKKI